MENIINVKNLSLTYNAKSDKPYNALKNINLTVKTGEFVAIMGPSGSGKSSLLNILASLQSPSKGEVLIDNQNVWKLNSKELADFRGKKLGFIFQEYNLIESLNVFDNIALPLNLSNTNTNTIKEKVNNVVNLLNLQDQLKKFPNELSGGQKQRVAAARALVHTPKLIFGDEPTGALDSTNAREMMNYLNKINTEEKISILMVTHDAFSASFANKIQFLSDGEIVETLNKENRTREEFYRMILDFLGTFEE